MQNTDIELAAQPVGYWTGLAHRRLIAHIRREMDKNGISQPQYWLLRHLSPQDLSPDGEGVALAELEERMTDYLLAEDDLGAEAADLLARGLLERDDRDRLRITPDGEAGRLVIHALGPGIRDRIHEGVDDADYVTTLRVLQRMISNVETG
ncbi:MarR family transcriptional regulator [Spirillospora sp. CA-294931]|uniref:MarR family transcriptional regulator n=1 Tax=Spirillospora sp. CA-294931 TaxID=3240042 RepID=UPI003D8CE873